MSEFIEIHWTSGSIDEARKICRYLVQEKMVACAQKEKYLRRVKKRVEEWGYKLTPIEGSKEGLVEAKTS